ncbi:MAG: DUF3276 family protein [Bacteroidales bacterium]|jgi:hypothetical protein|nr:DUF3276 family protein [Bacteroidales bacterium]MBR4219077.1 DUF3276 family protein [Bacteroidales bacterium]
MEQLEKNEILSRAVRAGKRTYFFDVKTTKSDERYLTITESKRKFNADNGTFFYEKHKLFLYKEDFEKFQKALAGVLEFIATGKEPDDMLFDNTSEEPKSEVNIDFEDLEA